MEVNWRETRVCARRRGTVLTTDQKYDNYNLYLALSRKKATQQEACCEYLKRTKKEGLEHENLTCQCEIFITS